MKCPNSKLRLGLLVGLIIWPTGGCTILSDLLNPSLATVFGLDPAILRPLQGTVIVAFRNLTRYPATFSAYESTNAVDPTLNQRFFSAEIAAGQVGNEVLDCPVEVIAPVDVVLQTDTTAVQVTYGNVPLIAGQSFACGDVVEIGVSTSGTGEALQYVITVRVIPGQH